MSENDNLLDAWRRRTYSDESTTPTDGVQQFERDTVPQPEYTLSDTPPVQENQDNMTVAKKHKWPFVMGAVAIVAAAYIGTQAYLGGHIASGTSVAGVPVGGLSVEDAKKKIDAQLSDQLHGKREVIVGEKSTKIDPVAMGIAIDYDATMKPLIGFTMNPLRIIAEFSGVKNVPAQLSANDQKLTKVLADAAKETNTDPLDATLSLDGGKARVTPDKPGHGIKLSEAKAEVLRGWLGVSGPITLPVDELAPKVTAQELNAFVDEKISPLLGSNVSVKVGQKSADLDPAAIATVLKVSKGANPQLSVDEAALEKLVVNKVGDSLGAPEDARIEIVDHSSVRIVPSKDGQTIDAKALAAHLLALDGERQITAKVSTKKAEFTTEDAKKLGVSEVVSQISTPLTSDSVRTTNLIVGTKKVSGTLIKPGERFDLGKALGEVDAAHGFVSSGVVSNGFNSTAMGGGLSQLSTNTFNVGYRSGMKDISHQPHSKYFSRYPMGLESTLWEPTIKMIWENNTPYGAVIDTWVSGGQVHTKLWSTKYWDVKIHQGSPYAYKQPTTRVNKAADCEASGAGGPGFSVKVGRTVSHAGKVAENSSYVWTYQPVDAVRCG
ncbi:VanW family protein [Arcanobacterium canis]